MTQTRQQQRGMTLIELAAAFIIFAVLAAAAYPLYQTALREAKLRAVQAALLENAQSMERFYLQHGSFKLTSTAWPELPVKTAEGFCIYPHGIARGALDDTFTLKAVAFDKNREPRILKIDESLNTYICEQSISSCSAAETGQGVFSDKNPDTDCMLFRP